MVISFLFQLNLNATIIKTAFTIEKYMLQESNCLKVSTILQKQVQIKRYILTKVCTNFMPVKTVSAKTSLGKQAKIYKLAAGFTNLKLTGSNLYVFKIQTACLF